MGEVTVLFRSLRTPSKTAGHPVAWLFLCSVKTVFFLAVVYSTISQVGSGLIQYRLSGIGPPFLGRFLAPGLFVF
nr:MAG TPA: hypothetical protein [Caudoviricetes sp.]